MKELAPKELQSNSLGAKSSTIAPHLLHTLIRDLLMQVRISVFLIIVLRYIDIPSCQFPTEKLFLHYYAAFLSNAVNLTNYKRIKKIKNYFYIY